MKHGESSRRVRRNVILDVFLKVTPIGSVEELGMSVTKGVKDNFH